MVCARGSASLLCTVWLPLLQVVVADVLCLHTPVLDSFNDISKAFPLGLAHLLASMPVHAYSSTACLHEMLR